VGLDSGDTTQVFRTNWLLNVFSDHTKTRPRHCSKIFLVYLFIKQLIHSQLNSAILMCDVIPEEKKLRSFDRQQRRPQN
jgi:hypothetical protein